MKMKAQILSLTNNSGTSQKTGRPYSINELYVLDSESERPEVLKVNVHDNDKTNAMQLIGKTVVIDLFYVSGNFRFGGQHVQAAAKAA